MKPRTLGPREQQLRAMREQIARDQERERRASTVKATAKVIGKIARVKVSKRSK
jgi:hypothetical protein